MKKTKILATLMALALIGADHLVKLWAKATLPQGSITVIPGLFKLSYVENRGAAFGIMQGNTVLLSVVTGIVMVAMLVLVYSGFLKERFPIYVVMLIFAGGMGNLIDRVFRGYVIDYLDFQSLFGFPVFNLADCCVVVGTVLLLIYIFRLEAREKREKAGSREER